MPQPFERFFLGIKNPILNQELVVEPTQHQQSPSQKKSGKFEDESSEASPWALASEGTQLALTLLLCFFVGYRIDVWKGTLPWFTLVGSFLGLTIGLYNFLRRFLRKP